MNNTQNSFCKMNYKELKTIIFEKPDSPLALMASIELERRKIKKDFFREDLVKWLALITALLSLMLGIYNSTMAYNKPIVQENKFNKRYDNKEYRSNTINMK